MPGGIGMWEIAVLAIVALLVFGPKRLPEMGRSLGRGMREFKGAITGDRDDGRAEELPAAAPTEMVPAPAPERRHAHTDAA